MTIKRRQFTHFSNISKVLFLSSMFIFCFQSGVVTMAQDSYPLQLRSQPLTVLSHEAEEIFNVTRQGEPLKYVENDFETQGGIVIDHSTNLAWQKSTPKKPMDYNEAIDYVKRLNRNQFEGYDDWRIPTVNELLSLQTPDKRSFYIDVVFKEKRRIYAESVLDYNDGAFWSADIGRGGNVWIVDFQNSDSIGYIAPVSEKYGVIAVHSLK